MRLKSRFASMLTSGYAARFTRIALLAVLIGPAQVFADVNHVDAAALKRLMADGVPVVDIRTAGEWKSTGIIEGSHLLTFFDERNQFDLDAWMTKFREIVNPDQQVVIICAAGVRSAAVSQVLDARLNYSRITNVAKGINDWRRRGGSVVPWTP